jgi:hypothetical protein
MLKELETIFSNPFWFLIFLSEERVSEIIESKIQPLFQRGAEARGGLISVTSGVSVPQSPRPTGLSIAPRIFP